MEEKETRLRALYTTAQMEQMNTIFEGISSKNSGKYWQELKDLIEELHPPYLLSRS